MEVYALIGASGTGKSHNAYIVMEQYGIDMMIDDGLLIKDGKKMAGSSAKAKETTVAAVKHAIFHDPLHASEVRERIKQLNPAKILILGTSEKMIDRITEALLLPGVKYKIFIQDISSSEQIAEAFLVSILSNTLFALFIPLSPSYSCFLSLRQFKFICLCIITQKYPH